MIKGYLTLTNGNLQFRTIPQLSKNNSQFLFNSRGWKAHKPSCAFVLFMFLYFDQLVLFFGLVSNANQPCAHNDEILLQTSINSTVYIIRKYNLEFSWTRSSGKNFWSCTLYANKPKYYGIITFLFVFSQIYFYLCMSNKWNSVNLTIINAWSYWS